MGVLSSPLACWHSRLLLSMCSTVKKTSPFCLAPSDLDTGVWPFYPGLSLGFPLILMSYWVLDMATWMPYRYSKFNMSKIELFIYHSQSVTSESPCHSHQLKVYFLSIHSPEYATYLSLASYNFFVIFLHNNHPKFRSLRQCTFSISQFMWLGIPGMVWWLPAPRAPAGPHHEVLS